jgi:tetratricopeptide (TPR) repeat protein
MIKRILAAAAVCVACWLAWASVRVGAARFITEHALRARAPQETELSARLAPADPDAYFARAWLLSNAGDLEGARRAYEHALTLRPLDHVLWLESGKVRERLGDAEGALASFQVAVRLAPAYAQPRWQLGHALLRAGRREEAFAELRRAAAGDPLLYPNMLQAVWHASGRDARALVSAASPGTPEETLAVVRFLIREGEPGEGLRLLSESGARLRDESSKTLVADLLAAERFADAYTVWSDGRGSIGSLAGGGFEEEARSDDGFGWRFASGGQSVRLSLDADTPREGARSLKVEYAGNSDPAQPAVSRLVAVEPGARYRLTFSARTKEVVTGGPPFVEVVSAGKSGEALGAAAPLPPATDGWQDAALEFTAPPSGAVRVALRRKPCASSPCPAFGAVWLDAFELKRLER